MGFATPLPSYITPREPAIPGGFFLVALRYYHHRPHCVILWSLLAALLDVLGGWAIPSRRSPST